MAKQIVSTPIVDGKAPNDPHDDSPELLRITKPHGSLTVRALGTVGRLVTLTTDSGTSCSFLLTRATAQRCGYVTPIGVFARIVNRDAMLGRLALRFLLRGCCDASVTSVALYVEGGARARGRPVFVGHLELDALEASEATEMGEVRS